MNTTTETRGPLAEFVRYTAEDRVFLHALLFAPARPSKSVVIYVAGFGGGFCGPNDLNPLAAALTEAGFAFLAVNTRTVAPPGLVFSRFEDCVPDIEAALQFAGSRGYQDVVVVGESLGGPRVIFHWAQKRPPAVKALVFLGAILSPYLEAQLRFPPEARAAYDAFLAEARALVAAGRGKEVLSHSFGPGRPLSLSAETFVNTWGAPSDGNVDVARFGPDVTVPTLVLHGARDRIAVPENGRRIYESLTSAPRRDHLEVDADHFFVSPPDAIAYARPLVGWLLETAPPRS